MNLHLANRQWMASSLADEIHGPGRFPGWKNDLYTIPDAIEPGTKLEIDAEDFYNKRHVRLATNEEILKEEPPSKKYGVGMLFPREMEEELGPTISSVENADLAEEISETTAVLPPDSTKEERDEAKKAAEKSVRLLSKVDEDDTDALGLSRLRRPRSMGITFVVDSACGRLCVDFHGARYRGMEVLVRPMAEDGKPFSRKIWFRVPTSASYEFDPSGTETILRAPLDLKHEELPGFEQLDVRIDVRVRSVPDSVKSLPPTARLVTITVVNDTQAGARAKEEEILFQSRFSVRSLRKGSAPFLPLPRAARGSDQEEESLGLLYRNIHNFATGHGCAGDWVAEEGNRLASNVIAEPLPFFETPPVTPDLSYPEGHSKAGQRLSIRMLPLARAEEGWLAPLHELADLYQAWILGQESSIDSLEPFHHDAARRHVEAAKQCLARIRGGLALIEENEQAALAFRLTNEAILLQQIAGRFPLREISFPEGRMTWSVPLSEPSLQHENAAGRSWRAFQIAFLLMSLRGLWSGQDQDREIADLIWFPTGGGKTEAYLGATAFHLISRRLQDADDSGTGVLMRYTLRLLTSQQFQRAAGLICALERIRLRERDSSGGLTLGENPFGIGIWVGGGTTPNNHKQSVQAYNAVQREGPEEYQHVMLRCPWCGSEMGPQRNYRRNATPKFIVHGLRSTVDGEDRKIQLHCPDTDCHFYNQLPVEVVDEGIYKTPPSLIIGTVDKFAMLAWRADGRSIFGIDSDGNRYTDPPGLIIQDELHLITGPLGSMVGLYEGVIEELCTKRSKLTGGVLIPKLIASTATTRASTRQIRDLYAREETAVFPPPGLNADDSFFATYDRFDAGPDKGKVKPGRMYIGVLARGYGSGLTVNVRVFSSLLAAAKLVPEDQRDPWYTLLVFYNALRELGAGLTLFGADIPERLANLRNRWTPGTRRRFLNHVLELTGRLENSEIPAALKALERRFPQEKRVVDACLASNIIEVGVDVPRLALMAVSGQPKNTAQYIQATGRVGREMPGLVVMTYDHRKARDLSHFEHFRDYHARLYAQVEPSSVTPFTVQLLERALHGAFLAWIRNRIPVENQQKPSDFYPAGSAARDSLEEFAEAMRQRVGILYGDDAIAREHSLAVFDRVLERRKSEWESVTNDSGAHLAVCWENRDLSDDSGDMPLLRRYGDPCRLDWIPYTWPTPSSMRGVDAECPASVVTNFTPESENSTA
jgi:hypothetical protein